MTKGEIGSMKRFPISWPKLDIEFQRSISNLIVGETSTGNKIGSILNLTCDRIYP